MKRTRLFIWMFLSLLGIVPLLASTSGDMCLQFVRTALEATDESCSGIGRNRACYGHVMLDAQPQRGIDTFQFSQVGDVVSVTDVKTLRLSAMDLTQSTWGVALMRLQANLPEEDTAQSVTMLLFGDVEIQNAVDTPTLLQMPIRSQANVNVRREPSETAFVMGSVASNQDITVRGRLVDNSWFYIDMPDESGSGWIGRNFLSTSGANLEELNIIDPALVEYGPMQAFFLETGKNTAEVTTTCAEAPDDGLLIQTPEGAAEVRLWINEVKIRVGSTIYVQSEPGNQMTISTLEGQAIVEANGISSSAVAGTFVTIPLGADNKPSGAPSLPQAYDTTNIVNLPVAVLPEQFAVSAPVITGFEVSPVPPTNTPLSSATPRRTNSGSGSVNIVEPTNTHHPSITPTITLVPSVTPPPTLTPRPTLDATLIYQLTLVKTLQPPTLPIKTATPVPTNTPVPPTDVPPTDVPPTDVPPTDEPPTAEPPTAEPPTAEPATAAPSGQTPPDPTTDPNNGGQTTNPTNPTNPPPAATDTEAPPT